MRALLALAERLARTRRTFAGGTDAAFRDGHANAVIPGPGGLEERADLLVGVTLMTAGLTYPDHDHPPEEVYLALTPDDPAACPPDIHVVTATKLPWDVIPESVPAVPGFYDRKRYRSAAARARRGVLLARRGGAGGGLLRPRHPAARRPAGRIAAIFP